MGSRKLGNLGSHETDEAEKSYIPVLSEFEKAVSKGDINGLIKLNDLIQHANSLKDRATLGGYCDNAVDFLRRTNLIIVACKYNNVKIVKYLLGNGSKVLNNLSTGIGRAAIQPNDEDETHHSAFYYAIRSGNVELLELLISKWPGDYFSVNLRQLDEILSRAYKELKLRNVPLWDKMVLFIENKLINLRFFSDTLRPIGNVNVDSKSIRRRIELVLENSSLAKAEHYRSEEVSEKFLFILRFIAQNIHILKRQLKSTYDRLPWEEMEFCLISFVSSHTKRHELNVFYRAVLNRDKILKYLGQFAKTLKAEKNIAGEDVKKLVILPSLQRGKIVSEIIDKYPHFEELYNDYKQVRDFHSLTQINEYTEIAKLADPNKKEGQLVIVRALQIMGESLKNTLESPKLSSTTSDLILLSLPKNTRKIVADLRNSLSHAYSLSKRMEIEENENVNFFIGVQSDMKKVGGVISRTLYNNKMKMFRTLLEAIVSSQNFSEMKEVTAILSNIGLFEVFSEKFDILEEDRLEKLIIELSNNISDKTYYEKELFNKISNIINSAKSKSKDSKIDYVTAFGMLKSLSVRFSSEDTVDHNTMRTLKFFFNKILESNVSQIEPHDFKEIAEVSMKICHSINARMSPGEVYEVNRLLLEILHVVTFGMKDTKWIETLSEKLNKGSSLISTSKQKKVVSKAGSKSNHLLAWKLSDLKAILNKNSLSDDLIENFPSYKSDKNLQATVEMLVLDIMSILGASKHCLGSNLFFLDDNTPLLTGQCLRNHLAHHNALMDILLSDPSMAVVLNAKKLTEESMKNKKLGQLVGNDPSKLMKTYDQDLVTLANQARMFAALEEGDLETLRDCLWKGADVYARSSNLWTTLHFASKGPSIDVVKFILHVNNNLNGNIKDVEGKSSLHIAAAYGRSNTVEYLIKETGATVDDLEDSGQTALHLASRIGHKDAVEVLLKHNADTNAYDFAGYTPLHYAVYNNHNQVAKILLEKEVHVDANETKGGFTSLHIAAENGHLDLVNFLIRNKANVNARNDRGGIPLHTAALNGHVEVVDAMVSEGADVNARVTNGCTPLHYAVENGHEKIADILLRHKADVDIFDKTYNNTPLHVAAKDGHRGIAKSLLRCGASANARTVEGVSPLHFATMGGHLEIVIILFQHGADVHAEDKTNATPLHYASRNGHVGIVELLIKHRAHVNARTVVCSTPLHLAALEGRKDVIDMLLLHKAEVNGHDLRGRTPLHEAAMNGSEDVIDVLIKNNAKVNGTDVDGTMSLHVACLKGHSDAVAFLIKSGADVNIRNVHRLAPLHYAIMRAGAHVVNLLIRNGAHVNATDIAPLDVAVVVGSKEVVELLIANGASVNAKNAITGITPLTSAVEHDRKELAEILIMNGAGVDTEDGKPLSIAVLSDFRDVVDLLLKNKACVNLKGPDNQTALHEAAINGNKQIANALITRGADVNAVTVRNVTPLFLAAQQGYSETVQLLIKHGSCVNYKCDEGITPLHISATNGHSDVVKVLLDNGGDVDLKDDKFRTSLELAVAYGRLPVVQMFLLHKGVSVNAKNNDGWTLLHIASDTNNLEVIKYLVDEGADINAKNTSGSQPMHIAAREGYMDIVRFFLGKGISVDEPGALKQTPLHYAAMKGRVQVVNYLISEGANVNATDANGMSAIHIAANFGFKDVVEDLLKNGAVVNGHENRSHTPLDMTDNEDVARLLASTVKLFDVVKHNTFREVGDCIKAGASVNARDTQGVTPLHYASWKGYQESVEALLENEANPNAIGKNGVTPLHYAAQFSHLKIATILLSNGAIYNAMTGSGKTPSDFAVDGSIIDLLKLVNRSFEDVRLGNCRVINDLEKINNIDTIKAIMRSRNRQRENLVVVAIRNKFPKVEQLKRASQGGVADQIDVAVALASMGNYQSALNILRNACEIRTEILGPDNPGTLDVQAHIAEVLYKQGVYQEALDILDKILSVQNESLGLNNADTLRTKSFMGLIFHRQGRNDEAFDIYQEVYKKQKQLLEPNHPDTLNTQLHMALVLDGQKKYEEALKHNNEVYQTKKKLLGANSHATITAQNNIALVLTHQRKYEEALSIYREVYERKKLVLGANHSDTLRTLQSIAGILSMQKNNTESLKAYEEVLSTQRNVLGDNHPDTLYTRLNIAESLFQQGKWTGALKAYKECFEQMKAVFGPDHASVLHISKMIEMINYRFKLDGSSTEEVLQHLQRDINVAASNGDVQAVRRLLQRGVNVNEADVDGRTPLHYAVANGYLEAVNVLLSNDADVTRVTNKGNTPLHTATSHDRADIVHVLLRHVPDDKLNDFVNAKTLAGGTSALHVAATRGRRDIATALLKHGAVYDAANRQGKTPVDLASDEEVGDLLGLVGRYFGAAKKGDLDVIRELSQLGQDEFAAVVKTRNKLDNTLLQVAVVNRHKIVANKLLEMLKRSM